MSSKKNKKRNKRFINYALILIVIVLSLFFLKKISTQNKMDKNNKKILIIGIDGMDPKITEELIEQGNLPNFQKLSEHGSFLTLNTSYPSVSPVAWTTIATGVNPGKHNIFDFIGRNPNTLLPELSISKSISSLSGTKYESNVKGEPFWKVTSKNNIPTTIIKWPLTFPPEKVNGKMISGLGVPDIKGFLSGYTYYTTDKSEKSSKPSNTIIHIDDKKDEIKTVIYGPKVWKNGNIVDVTAPIKITKNKEDVLMFVNDKEYGLEVDKWSDWIRVSFNTSIFKKTTGIFKVYLKNIDPFEMYVTAVQIDPANPLVDVSYPSKYSSELVKKIGPYYSLGMPEETDGYGDDKLTEKAFLEQIEDIENEREKMFWLEFEVFKKEDKAIFALVFDSSDRLQHMFWHENELKKEKSEINGVLIEYYMKKDKMIGNILEEINEDTILLILSDHGFTSFEKTVNINTWLVENGFMTLTKDIKEVKEGGLFQDVDWNNTEAYSLGFSSIYINLKGREKKGIVENKDEVVQKIISKLEQLKDSKTGNKPIYKIYKKEDIYSGEYLNDAPDLIIGFNPGYRMGWETAIGGFGNEVIMDNEEKWKGDHIVDPRFVPGVLFSNIKLNQSSASVLDITPTIYDSFGIKIPKDIDGKSLFK